MKLESYSLINFRKSNCPWIDFKIKRKIEDTIYLLNTVNTGRPALEVDDTFIVDNLPAHHERQRELWGSFWRNVDRTCLPPGLFPRPESSGGGIFETEIPAEIQISAHCSLESWISICSLQMTCWVIIATLVTWTFDLDQIIHRLCKYLLWTYSTISA